MPVLNSYRFMKYWDRPVTWCDNNVLSLNDNFISSNNSGGRASFIFSFPSPDLTSELFQLDLDNVLPRNNNQSEVA